MKIKTSLAIIALTIPLAACMGERPRPMPVVINEPPRAQGVEGRWSDQNGIVSTFENGTFTTRTTDTNQLLASGTYLNPSPNLVEINMTSLVRKTQSKVNCAMVTPDRLNCTSDGGAQFSLTRRG